MKKGIISATAMAAILLTGVWWQMRHKGPQIEDLPTSTNVQAGYNETLDQIDPTKIEVETGDWQFYQSLERISNQFIG